MRYLERSVKITIGLAALILLYLSRYYNYLLFHTLAEVFSICIAGAVFLVTWNSARVIQNKYLLFVGFAYLFIGFMDLMHTISFPGMAIIADYGYHANQVWIAARYFESIVLLLSFLLVKSKKHFNIYVILSFYAAVTAVLMLSVFVWHIFPVCYVEGAGQTQFKVISEYIIVAILIAAIVALRKNKDAFNGRINNFLLVSLLCTIASELCFTVYKSNYDFMNLLGHFFKIFSFYFIYRTIIQTGIREPYDLIFREMKQTEQQLYEQNRALSIQTVADNLTIQEHLNLLRQQYKILNRQAEMLDLSHEAIFVWDLYGTIFYWNKGAQLMYGYTAEEAIGRRSDELLSTKHPVSLEEKISLLERNGLWFGQLVHMTKDGEERIVEAAHQMYTDEDGRKIVFELCRDVTERNRLEADIRYRNNLLYAVIENMHDAFFVYDRNGRLTSVNARARGMYHDLITDGTTADSIFEDCRVFDLERHPLDRENYPTRRAFRGESIRNERVIIECSEWRRIIEVNATPIVDANDEVMAMVVCHHDITELMEKQQAISENVIQLRQQNKLLNRQAMLLDLSNEAIFAWYMDGPIITWNQGAEKMYGYSDDDAVGCLPKQLLKPLTPISGDELRAELLEKRMWTGVIEHTTKDGRHLIVETHMQLIVSDIGLNTVLETNRDVTEKIRAENEIRKTAVELKNIINSTDDFIWSVDADYKIIFCNRSVYEFTRTHYGVEMEPGLPFLDILPPENASSYRELFDRVKTDGEFTVDMHSFRGDRNITYSFHSVYVDSQLIEIIVFGRDITERVKAEQEIIKLNASLEARIQERTHDLRESLETIQNFTMMMTHDLKTPLHEIDVYAKQLRVRTGCEENADKISGLCTEMNSMITQLMEYDRISRAEVRRESVDLKEMIDTAFDELKNAYALENALLEYQTGMPKILADKALLRRVVTNLLSNALKFSAMQEKPRIVVGCRRENDDYVFYIKDNGIGIDMAYAGKLFNVFERLHDAKEFEGHGLGLASVRSIISKHGGRTWINGKVDMGTTVSFSIPAEPREG